MSQNHRFKVVYTKMQELLGDETRRKSQRAIVSIRHGAEISSEELDEIARLREIVLETISPGLTSFTTT